MVCNKYKNTLDSRPASNALWNLAFRAFATALTSFSGTAKQTECSLLAYINKCDYTRKNLSEYIPYKKIKKLSYLRDHNYISSSIFNSFKDFTCSTGNSSHPRSENKLDILEFRLHAKQKHISLCIILIPFYIHKCHIIYGSKCFHCRELFTTIIRLNTINFRHRMAPDLSPRRSKIEHISYCDRYVIVHHWNNRSWMQNIGSKIRL